MLKSLSVTCDMLVNFSGPFGFLYQIKIDRHDITEILLKVALNAIKQTKNFFFRLSHGDMDNSIHFGQTIFQSNGPILDCHVEIKESI